MPSLFIYTLGPVQDFIAAAKRCRDLWFGSWLLSELSKAGAAAIAARCGLDALIFPAPRELRELEPASEMSVANKLVALLPAEVTPRDLAVEVESRIRDRLRVLRDEAFHGKNGFDRALANQQIDDLVETQWVSVPVPSPYVYAKARKRAEEILAAAKNTRLWDQPAWPTGARPKSSIDGLRESVIPDDVLTVPAKRRDLGLDEGEHLCGIGILKRNGRCIDPNARHLENNHRFFSTPHLAAGPLLARLGTLSNEAREQARQSWQSYLGALGRHGADLEETVHPKWRRGDMLGGHDGQLLFASRIAERLEHVPDDTRKKAALADARPLLGKFLRAIGVTGDPLPYISILVADGDHMGPAIEGIGSADGHRELSRALDGFATGARATVEQCEGQLIYAGGDDVLAFVPLHRAIECARVLSEAFSHQLAGYGHPTLSVGLSISHFMDPMTSALKLARRAEKLAKRKRNSLAIILDKRSGPPVEIAGTWEDGIDRAIAALVLLQRHDAIPDKFTQDLIDLQHLRDAPDHRQAEMLREIASHEFKRILSSKRASRGAQPLTDAARKRLDPNDPDLVARLLIAKILADAEDLAARPLEDLP